MIFCLDLSQINVWLKITVFKSKRETLPKGDLCTFRSSRPEVFYKKNVLQNFEKFTGKHLY